MEKYKSKLLTIVCESRLEKRLIEDFKEKKVRGYTMCEAKGDGNSGFRAGDWEQNKNIRIEIVCNEYEAEHIMMHLKENYYEHNAMISFLSDVEVMRPEKFN